MAEPPRPESQDQPPSSEATSPSQEPRFDEAEFLRKTFDRSIQEMERSRTFFEKLLKWTYGSLALLITVGIGLFGFFWFKSWSDVKKQMEDELTKTKGAIVEEGRKTIAETENDIRDKAANIFKEESIKKYVREIAKEKTESELSGLIKQAVNDKVAAQIKAEEPQIRNTVISESKKAVADLNPFISSEVRAEVQKQSSESLEPLRQQVENYQEVLNVSTMALLARNGDGVAYDQIQRIAASATKDSVTKVICLSTINQIFVEMNSGIYAGRSFTEERSVEEMNKLLDDPNAIIRWAAVDGLAGKKDKSIVPKLIIICNQDKYLWVRRAAYEALRQLTNQKFENFRQDQWNKWWEQNKESWPPK
ncbi:MAG: hypothetical protein A2W09_09255 [Deltaproteobacteria bacterium RBG_16_50_11]|nr:MAG: hypothetical protein A2W09_09255 [Deltaproteobacteria bacterium RBG_16_50_11]